MNIVLTCSVKKEDESKPPDYYSEYDSSATIDAIVGALELKGHLVSPVDVDAIDIVSYFQRNGADIVFNIAEGKLGKLRESYIPVILDCFGVPYTGSNAFSLSLAMNKALTKKVLRAENIPTPNFQVFYKGNEKINRDLRFPLIVKPNCEGSGKGISVSSVVNTEEDLYLKIQEVTASYKQEVLVEEFIFGKELTVGILENRRTVILPVLEVDFSSCKDSGEYFYSWRMKEFQGNKEMGLVPTFHCPARIDKRTEARVKEVALRSHHAVGCFDVSRIDIRLGEDNVPYVLEVNPLPGLDPRDSNLPMMAYAAGMKYEDLIESILIGGLKRAGRLN